MGKAVGFVGCECEDIVVYLARILHSFGKRVAIIDRTEQELLLEIFEMRVVQNGMAREGDFSGVWITDQGVAYEEYDMVFYLFGYRLIHPKLYECEILIMVTDGVPAHASMLRKIGHWDRKQYLLIRNLIPMRHTEEYLAILADNEKSYYGIPYDEQDIRMRCSMNAYTECALKCLSHGMRKALELLVCFIDSEYQEKSVREAMRKL